MWSNTGGRFSGGKGTPAANLCMRAQRHNLVHVSILILWHYMQWHSIKREYQKKNGRTKFMQLSIEERSQAAGLNANGWPE